MRNKCLCFDMTWFIASENTWSFFDWPMKQGNVSIICNITHWGFVLRWVHMIAMIFVVISCLNIWYFVILVCCLYCSCFMRFIRQSNLQCNLSNQYGTRIELCSRDTHYVPGHVCTLQSRFSFSSPIQSLPPLVGLGLVHVRDLNFTPGPHGAEQAE